MHFEYEITADQYVAAQVLYHELSCGRKHSKLAARWILAGTILVVMAWSERSLNWTAAFLALIGICWIYSGVKSLFVANFFRRKYPKSGLAGKRLDAEVGEEGFEVTGDDCSWRVRWTSAREKAENERVFMFHSHGTLFTFGKVYLDAEQQEQLRKFSGLAKVV